MSDTKETTEKPARERKPLQLKRTVEAGLVQQKVGHGRANTVVVEKRTKRKVMAAPGKSESAEAKPARKRGGKGGGSSVKNPGGLSDSEMAARAQALAAAQLRAVEEEKTRAADAERRASEEAERVAREKAEADAEKKRLADEADRKSVV